MISNVRNPADPAAVLDSIAAIISTASQIINKTSEGADVNDQQLNSILQALSENVDRLEDADKEGEEISTEDDWKVFVQGLPPLSFAINRSTKELLEWVEKQGGHDDFS